MSDDNSGPGGKKRKRLSKPASPYAEKPYRVGKGKAPPEHRFTPGNKGGGRPRGSRNKNAFDKHLDNKVVIGHDSLGRPVRKTVRGVIDIQLLKKAAEGDLRAIKMVKDYEHKQAALDLARGDPPATTDELEKRRKTSSELIKLLELGVRLKKLGILGSNTQIVPWAAEAIREYREKHGISIDGD